MLLDMQTTTTTQETTMSPTTAQMSYIRSLADRAGFYTALPVLQGAYDETEAGQRQGYELGESNLKWLARAITREQASALIDELQYL